MESLIKGSFFVLFVLFVSKTHNLSKIFDGSDSGKSLQPFEFSVKVNNQMVSLRGTHSSAG